LSAFFFFVRFYTNNELSNQFGLCANSLFNGKLDGLLFSPPKIESAGMRQVENLLLIFSRNKQLKTGP
jgi:hypothetical protein